ncbi:regulatory protein RecX [Arthrobacter sp. MDT2-2]
MPTDAGSEPVDWGTSFGRFDSGSSADAEGAARRPAAKRQGLTRSASLGAPSSGARSAGGAGWGAPGHRRRSSGRPPADDPFGPVVGSSADSSGDNSAHDSAGGGSADEEALRGARRARGASRSRSARGGSAGGRPARGSAGGGTADSLGEGPAGGTEPSRSEEDWASEARSILLRQLALGARSRHQLARKLADREIPAAVAAALLDRFEEVQLIDDAEFARMWVRTRTGAKALSRSSLRRELADKGIDPDLAEDALLQISDEDEHAQARDVVRRKLRGSADLSDRAVRDKEVRRLVGVLARKGYSPGTAFSIVKGVLAEAEAQD